MHWLPLVAMVIASALFFLRCPSVPRLVAMEPGSDVNTVHVNISPLGPVSNASRTERNLTGARGESGPRDGGASSLTYKRFLSDGGQSERSKSGSTESLKLQANLNHVPADHRSTGASPERSTLKQWPRHLQPPSKATYREDAAPADLDLRFSDEQLLLDSHPRVLFSTSSTPPKHPPLQLMLESGFVPEDGEEDVEEDKASGVAKSKQARDRESYRNLLLGISDPSGNQPTPPRRRRRQLGHTGLERSVCESVSAWVKDRRSAVDMFMQNVTVLEKFPSKKGMLTQYFYETRCRGPDHSGVHAGEHGMAGGGCLGVDKRHWVSECQTKQTFVRAFTTDNVKGTGWRWIRIDSACVCVLYSKAHKNRLITAGRGGR
ncbi:neurotrophin-3 [Trichomycterus rosablanca]|uniref:neurotrophin-3 n=1 Tax=Trichomycterus rosablanca TaxID=2290929 RepID=UPI002F35C3AD